MKDNISWVGCQPRLGGNGEISLFFRDAFFRNAFFGDASGVMGWVRLPAMVLG